MERLRKQWQELYNKVIHEDIDLSRDLVITPFFGHYGLAGYVIVMQGSPTHGMAILDLGKSILTCIYLKKIKIVVISGWGEAPGIESEKQLYRTTIEIIEGLNLPIKTGYEENPAVYYVRSGANKF